MREVNGTVERSTQMVTSMQIKKKSLYEMFLPFFLLQLFIVALSFACFSKALTGTYMKSSITQIERRFDLSSTHIGLIDGSFEMGNDPQSLFNFSCSIEANIKLFQCRQLAVSGRGQPFWSQAAPSEAHCRWVLPHGCWGHSHWTHALLHGKVHQGQMCSSK